MQWEVPAPHGMQRPEEGSATDAPEHMHEFPVTPTVAVAKELQTHAPPRLRCELRPHSHLRPAESRIASESEQIHPFAFGTVPARSLRDQCKTEMMQHKIKQLTSPARLTKAGVGVLEGRA